MKCGLVVVKLNGYSRTGSKLSCNQDVAIFCDYFNDHMELDGSWEIILLQSLFHNSWNISSNLHFIFIRNYSFLFGPSLYPYWIDFFLFFLFYHIACTATNLKEEWDAHFKGEQHIRGVCQRYERILHLVNRANELFGNIIGMRNFFYILYLCLSLYYTLVLFRDSSTLLFISTLGLIFLAYQILWTNWLMS